jgi:hypothetical protein
MHLAEARIRLQSMTAFDSDPALSVAEIELLLADARRPDPVPYPYVASRWGEFGPGDHPAWQPLAVYAVGDVILPTNPNGHVYSVTVAGTSTVTSATVTFAEAGRGWVGAWDLNYAAAEGWRWKAAKAAARYDLSANGNSLSRSQLVAHCEQMADMYTARLATSVTVVSASRSW